MDQKWMAPNSAAYATGAAATSGCAAVASSAMFNEDRSLVGSVKPDVSIQYRMRAIGPKQVGANTSMIPSSLKAL